MKKLHNGRGKSWMEFAAWCKRRKLNHLPAHPWTIAAYLLWCETRKPFLAIEEAREAIARVHILGRQGAPHRHRTVERTLHMIELRAKHRGLYGDLFRETDFTAAENRGENRGETRDENKDENKDAALENRQPATRRAQSMRNRPPLVSRR